MEQKIKRLIEVNAQFALQSQQIKELLSRISFLEQELSLWRTKANSRNHYSHDFIYNFRDVAMINKKFQPNKIFRSSTLTRYQNESFFTDIIQQLGINKIVDLRDRDEYDKDPYINNSIKLFEHLHLSFDSINKYLARNQEINCKPDFQSAYRYYALGNRKIFKAMFEQINPEKDVFLIHCKAGKDRTGCVVALLGLLVGESIENINRDYLESEMDTEIEKLNAFLEVVQEKGNVENFLSDCGISQNCINHWKKHLTNEN